MVRYKDCSEKTWKSLQTYGIKPEKKINKSINKRKCVPLESNYKEITVRMAILQSSAHTGPEGSFDFPKKNL